ncbi:hypothetical protein [Bacteroides cellulosilyticus]|uniref:Uncharacterized protein n=1 Tax=Bacteroides cellulosilyticus TaxID=246787 RepID=A0A642PTS4_9BACE|nr:hypothetical protein [Bacteroides cellulosilyticus]KAA5415996.1 hypothetical protein F2Y81_16670 [Bacteroides cellulosilyticus]
MSYSLIYTVPFATLDNIPCVVEIEKDGYEGTPTELTAGAIPFTVDIESEEFLYTPTRFSTAKLQVVGNDYLQTLFSTEYRQYRVTFKKAGVITWCGFIKPELYTQDYASETFVLEIECISAMSVLEFIDYTIEGDSKEFVSIWRLLQRCISTAAGQYNSVFIPHVYASSKAAYFTEENVLSEMTLSEQDFFDEDDKPMKLKEVLEEVCKFLNWTCTDWKGDIYFVDVDHTGTYHKYDSGLGNKVDARINELLVQDIGFAGSNHSLDVLPGYNKATVTCSNYAVEDLIPDLFDSSLLNPLIKDSPYYRKIDGDKYSHFVKFYTNKRFNNLFSDKDSLQQINVDLEPMGSNADNAVINNIGSLIAKQSKYKWADGEPSTLSFEDILIIGMGLSNKNYSLLDDLTIFLNNDIPVLQINPDYLVDTVISPPDEGATSYLLLSGEYFQSDSLYTDPGKEGDGNWNNVAGDNCCKFKLKIGDKYWNGSKWVKEETRFIIRCGGYNKSKIWYSWNNFENNVKYSMNIDSEGYAIPIRKEDHLLGKIELTVLRPMPNNYGEGGKIKRYPYYTFMRNLKLQLYKGTPEIEKEDNSSDRTYENVLNENYINELDEIEFKISSYNEDGACYSKVMLGNDYLKDNLYNSILDDTIRPEEMMITRCINHYSTTRIKLTQEIKERADLSPITRLSDTFLVGKKFINAGGSIDYKMNKFECIMIEV